VIAVTSPTRAVELLARFRESLADQLQAFELIPCRALRYLNRHMPTIPLPFTNDHPWYVLIESSLDDEEILENALAEAIEKGLGSDAVVAKNASEQEALWRIRHSISEAQKFEGVSLKHDVSVPLGKIGEFIEVAEAAVLERIPDARVVAFGHVGDGNVHFNISQPKSSSAESFRDKADALSDIIYDIVIEFGGSISAEHGVGQFKRDALKKYLASEEIAVMKTIKAALDPGNILNPGKVL